MKSLITKLKTKKIYFTWLAVVLLAALFFGMIGLKYFNHSANIEAAYKNKQFVALDLTTGEQVDISKILHQSPKDKAAEAAAPPVPPKKSEILLIISNLGLNRADTEKAITLPKEVIL